MSILALCKDPTAEKVLLIVTQFQNHDGSYLCIPLITKDKVVQNVKLQISAMRFVNEIDLDSRRIGSVSIPDQIKWDIEEYILENQNIFKEQIQAWDKAFSPIKGNFEN